MADANFDPYHKWLGIPSADQPLNHYRLLGLTDYETDVDAIAIAADRQARGVGPFESGPHRQAAQRILKQIAKARLCLLDPQKKQAYDTVLKAARCNPYGGKVEQVDSPTEDPNIGQRLGDYLLLKRITRSSTGGVYKARHLTKGWLVAVKLMPKAALESSEVLKRFHREFNLARRLDNPHIVAAFESGEQQGVHYFAMEYFVGTDLATVVKTQGPLQLEQAQDYMRQAAEGLGYLHQQGVVHRNVKPQNLLINLRGVVKVSNLLMAGFEEGAIVTEGTDQESLTKTGQMIGSVDYIAPEQAADSKRADHRADIYSLGCTLYELLSGEVPYPRKSLIDKLVAHRSDSIPSLRSVRPDAPKQIDRVIEKMLAKDPAARFQSMQEVIEALGGDEQSRLLGILLPATAGVIIGLLLIMLVLFLLGG